MNQRWRLLALWLLPIGVVLLIGWQVLSNGGINGMSQNNSGGNSPTVAPRNAAVARMSYGRFLDYVEAGRITAVDIYDGGRNAVVEAVDPDLDNRVQRLRVDLPGLAPELINTLKQEGISFLLFDMDLPGIKVEPVIMFSGEHELNQVFFDNVRVPQANRVGPENKGWTVAKYLLEFERGGIAYTPPVKAGLKRLREIAEQEAGGGQRLIDDDDFRRQLSHLETQVWANETTEKRVISALSNGQNPGSASSMFKLRGSELLQQMLELTMRAIGYYGGVSQPDAYIPGANVDPIAPKHGVTATAKYFNQRAATIYAGSSEVQRGIIAKHVLGL